MADSLARLIVTLETQTAQYQKGLENANRQLAGFGRTQKALLTTVEGSFTKFSHSIHTLLSGGGFLIGFRTIERELSRVAEKFKDTDLGAREFTDSLERLGAVTDEKWLSALQLASPVMDAIATAAETAAKHVTAFAAALGGLGGLTSAAALQALMPGKQPIFSGKIVRSGGAEETVAAELAYEQQKNLATSQKALENAKKFDEAMAEIKRKNIQDDVDQEMAGINEIYEAQVAANQKLLDDDAELSAQFSAHDAERVQRLNDQAEAFGSLFSDNLVQAADYGFKSVLESWVRTLQQMALKAAASGLFKALFSNAPAGGFLSGVASIFGGGKAGGGAVMAGTSYMVGESGPEMFTPRTSGTISPNGAGGVVINQNIDARGSDSPARLFSAMTVAKNAALAEMNENKKRGR